MNIERMILAGMVGSLLTTSVMAAEEFALEEIVVTAQKRAENLQEVPIAITAMTADTLADMRIDTTQDLVTAVPSLNYAQSGARAQAYLRGVGNNITQENSDPSVATYIDGVNISSSAVTISRFAEVERVEVVKGPQGTLYGRNATGGAINVVTRSPTDVFEGKATLGVGNYNLKEAAGFVSGPISDRVKGGLYFGGARRDPYVELRNPPGVPVPKVRDNEQEYGVRGKLIVDATDALKLTGSADITKYNSFEDMAWRQFQPNATGYNPANSAAIGTAVNNIANSKRVTARDVAVSNDWDSKGASLRADLDLASTRVMLLSAYRKATAAWVSDSDVTEARTGGATTVSEGTQTSHELQWLSGDGSKVQWIVGAFLFKAAGNSWPFSTFNATTRTDTFAAVDTSSKALFGQATVPFGSGFRATLGVRYTDETKDYLGGYSQTVTLATGATTTPVVAAAKEASYSEVTPKLVLDYTIGKTMVYASYSRGFKSGIFNLTSVTDVGPVNPEILNAYEIGSKSDFLNSRIRLNSSVFFYDYKDLQVQAFIATNVSRLVNAADAEIKGVELEGQFAATENLTFSANLSHIESKYKDFIGFPGLVSNAGTTVSGGYGNRAVSASGVEVSGLSLARTPKWAGSVGARYTHNLSSGAEINANASYYYSDKYFFNADHTVGQDAYGTLDASVKYVAPNRLWDVSVWGKNLTDEYYFGYKQVTSSATYGVEAPPRTFGVTASVYFGKR